MIAISEKLVTFCCLDMRNALLTETHLRVIGISSCLTLVLGDGDGAGFYCSYCPFCGKPFEEKR